MSTALVQRQSYCLVCSGPGFDPWQGREFLNWFRLSRPASMYMVSSGLVAVVSGYKFLMFHPYLWQAYSELAASTVASEEPEVGCCFPTYSVFDVTAEMSSWHLIGSCHAWVLIGCSAFSCT